MCPLGTVTMKCGVRDISLAVSTVRTELEHRHYWNAEHFQFTAHLSAQIVREEPHRPVGEGVSVRGHTLPFLNGT